MGNTNLTAPPTEGQFHALRWAAMLSAIPSILGSSYIIRHVLRNRTRRQRTVTRILLGMASMDLILALRAVSGSMAIPKDAFPGINYARGSWASCEATAFLAQGSRCSTVLYNGTLSLCYLLIIRYRWTDRDLRKLEIYLHAAPLGIGWTTAIVALVLDLYNPTPAGCTIQEYPPGCLVSGDCTRGADAGKMRFFLFFSWVWAVFFFSCVIMYLIHAFIGKTSRRSSSYNFRPGSVNNNHESMQSRFATQAYLYCFVYALTWFPGTFNAVVHENWIDTSLIPILFMIVIFEPMQGFWNAVIYFRPRYLNYRRKSQSQTQDNIEEPGMAGEAPTIEATAQDGTGVGAGKALRLALAVDKSSDDLCPGWNADSDTSIGQAQNI